MRLESASGVSTFGVESEVCEVCIFPCYAGVLIVAHQAGLDSAVSGRNTLIMSDSPEMNTDGRDETSNERADRNWEELMQELRVMQTGTQVLSGFLLAVAFAPRFTELSELQLGLYIVLVVLAGLATILALTPVGMHRVLFGKRRKPELVRLASRIVKADLFVVGALSIGVVTLIVDFTLTRTIATIVLAGGTLIVVSLWILLPMLMRRA